MSESESTTSGIHQLALTLLAGELYINTTQGIMTSSKLVQLLGSYLPCGPAAPTPSPYLAVSKPSAYTQRVEWFIAERQKDGTFKILFDVEDGQEAEYFLSKPERISEQVQHIQYTRNLKARSEGKSAPPQKGIGKTRHEEAEKRKPVDPEEAASMGVAEEGRRNISCK